MNSTNSIYKKYSSKLDKNREFKLVLSKIDKENIKDTNIQLEIMTIIRYLKK